MRQLEGRTHRLGGTESADKRRMTKRKAADTGSSNDIEKRMLAIADQVGRIAGTVQAKAEGWLDSDALSAQLSGGRDSATELLDQIGASKPVGASKRGAQAALANRSSAGATAPLKAPHDHTVIDAAAQGQQVGCYAFGGRETADENGTAVDQRAVGNSGRAPQEREAAASSTRRVRNTEVRCRGESAATARRAAKDRAWRN